MVTSLKNLKNEIDSRLAGGSLSSLACCQLDNAQTILSNNIVHSVANLASLPSAALNEGRFVYIDDINEYRFSTGVLWMEDVSSSVAVFSREIYGWGRNNCGTIADGTILNKCSPVREFCSATDWCQVSTSDIHTTAIKTSGQLWSWGGGGCGNLGNGTVTSISYSPVREFCSATDWCQVCAGCRHSVALKSSGELWSWGGNNFGSLGDGTVTARCSPVRERCSATDWRVVSTKNSHTVAVKTTSEIWTWGYNNCGQLGDGTVTARCSPIREISSSTDWCGASAGCRHTVAIKTTGEIWAWGSSFIVGLLGDGTTVNRCSPVREISSSTDWCFVNAGEIHTMAIKTSGQLWGWGFNNQSQLADNTTTCRCSPVREICSATDWCFASGGCEHATAVKTSGQLWVWGCNGCGRLGDGTLVNRTSPVREFCSATDWCQVSAGRYHTVGIISRVKGFLE